MNMYEILSYKKDGRVKKAILLGSLLFLLLASVVSSSTMFPCKDTLYPEVCQSLITSTNDAINPTTIGDMFSLSLKYTVNQAHSIRSLAYNISRTVQNQKNDLSATLDDCVELLDHSLHQLTKILDDESRVILSPDDIQTWLSSAITHQTTCADTLQNHKNDILDVKLQNNIKHISNSLALHKSIVSNEATTSKGGGSRKLLSDEFPRWVSNNERKLLEASVEDMQPHAVVALDGTGTHKSIGEAIAFASLAGSGRTVIHVTAGTYSESNLKIPLKQSNVLLVGDGKGTTIITGSKSNGDGSTTFNSATFGVSGDGFMARDITFVNTAGPGNHQAVALRVSSDKSVFYRCSIVGYQDTLYTLSNRQFYRETDIYGSVDFIFGDSAVVFQNCNIFPRKAATKNFITAQGRSDPNQNTGISIHKCKIAGSPTPTYLGRPWKKYSRTVIMQSYIDGSINSAGWFPWSGSSYLDSLYYAEYMNTGPGASTSGRVKWGGYHASITSAEASKFTVGNLISGNSWLPSTGVVFDSGL